VSDHPFAITLEVGSSLANKTGSWRVERPAYVDRLPPCNDACPAGENVQGWLYRAEEGDYEGAWRALVEDNPLPAIMGRVCYRPCETVCNRGRLDEAVGINAVERFLGDRAIAAGWELPQPGLATGKRVLVVGAGPAGLSAAYHLRRLGHEATVVDSAERPGGMMRFGIPRYRLPREILDAEVERILALGVTLSLGQRVNDLAAAMDGFDAALLAVGAQIAKRAYIPAGDSARVLDAVALLHSMEGEEPPTLGRRVVVYGGGDTAMDAARTARRLGATESLVVYRRTRERMPAHPLEVEEAIAEGVEMRWLTTVSAVEEDKLVVEQMELDETGFPRPTGRLEVLPADSLILALGQDSDLSLVSTTAGVELKSGAVVVGEDLMTGHEGIFAVGDAITEDRTVTTAVGHGKRAARAIGAWLAGGRWQHGPRHELAAFEGLNPWYYADAPKTLRPQLEVARRVSTFDEIEGGLVEEDALFEARRCLSCGNCFECDNCYGVCPDNAVIKLGPGLRYRFDYDFCKGCGICVKECPCGAIAMEPETI
jgi:NADPH-dependent glutamate synthase beta subunit-like oxidoreductase